MKEEESFYEKETEKIHSFKAYGIVPFNCDNDDHEPDSVRRDPADGHRDHYDQWPYNRCGDDGHCL